MGRHPSNSPRLRLLAGQGNPLGLRESRPCPGGRRTTAPVITDVSEECPRVQTEDAQDQEPPWSGSGGECPAGGRSRRSSRTRQRWSCRGEHPDPDQAPGGDLSGERVVRPLLRDLPECVQPCLLYTSPSPRDGLLSRMPSSA